MQDIVILHKQRVFPHRPALQMVKRILDLILVLAALPLVLPVMAVCALAIRLDSPGPVLFVQDRIGKGSRAFRMFKFRTMQHNLDDREHRAFMKAYVAGLIQADSLGAGRALQHPGAAKSGNGNGNGNGREAEKGAPIFKPIQPSQITRVGRILRKTSLDELPQIWNVVNGEMSIVGPRPNVPWEVEAYRGWHIERLEVLPGITGLAQVRGRSSLKFDDIVRYDIEYLEKQSLWLDVKIMWWTVTSVLLRKGAS